MDQEPHRFMNFTQWGDKVAWDRTLKRPQMITSLEWDPMSWMTSDNEVEIRARSMEDEGECKVFYRNFGGHWDKEHNRFFRIPKERVDFQKKSMKGWPGWVEVTFRSLLANTIPRPLGGQNFSLLLKKPPFSMSSQRKTMLQMRTMTLSKVGTQT
jgi:hypothetical protein